MLPKLAFLACLIFTITAFYIDRLYLGRQSLALWLPLAWLSLAISKPVSFWVNPKAYLEGFQNASDYLSGNPIDRNILSVLMLMAIIVLYRRRVNWKHFLRNNKFIFILFLYVGISILWSHYPSVSFKRWIRTCGDLLVATVVVTDKDSVEGFKWVMRGCGYILIPLSVVLVKYFRDLGVAYTDQGATMWTGVAGHKNSLGQLACTVAIFFIWSYFTEEKKTGSIKMVKIIIIIMALWLLNGSSSAVSMTSRIIFVLALMMFYGLNKFHKMFPHKIHKYVTAIIFSGITFYVVSVVLLPGVIEGFLVQQAGRDMTLTGRTDLWAALMVIGMKSPILGSGYGSFWIGNLANDLWEKFIWHPTQAHNGYIDIFINIGLLGLGIFFAALAAIYKKIMYAMVHNFNIYNIKFIIFVMVLIYNITESSLIKPTSFLWFLFLVISIDTYAVNESG